MLSELKFLNAKIPLQLGRNFEYFQRPQTNGQNINLQEFKLTQMESILWQCKICLPFTAFTWTFFCFIAMTLGFSKCNNFHVETCSFKGVHDALRYKPQCLDTCENARCIWCDDGIMQSSYMSRCSFLSQSILLISIANNLDWPRYIKLSMFTF